MIVVLSLVALVSAVGAAARLQSSVSESTQRRVLETGRPFDLAILGEGYFQICDGNRILYTRAGSFSLNSTGAEFIVTSAGRERLLEPSICVPADSIRLEVTPDGGVWVLQEGQSALTQIGQLQLARFTNPQGLVLVGDGLLDAKADAGVPLISVPGDCGLGIVRQGCLEASTVKSVQKYVATANRLCSDFRRD
jgi:flagellar basal-body rod protein FlgG